MATIRRRGGNKFGALKTVVDGITFDSRGESERYKELKYLEKAGQIRNLKLQVSYDLAPAAIVAGKKKLPLRYIADFTYFDAMKQREVVEDYKGKGGTGANAGKGILTDVYKIKRHLMKVVHNIDILES